MDTPVEEQQVFQHITCLIPTSEDEIVGPSCLSVETIEQAQVEVERLSVLKATKMKELVLRKRLELEEVCKSAHLEPDINLAADKLIAVIDSGIQRHHIYFWPKVSYFMDPEEKCHPFGAQERWIQPSFWRTWTRP